MPDWMTESIRLTVFTTDSIKRESACVAWESVAGAPPEIDDSQPRLGVSNISGQWRDGQLLLHVEPLRCDWVWSAQPNPTAESSAPSSLGVPLECVTVFKTSLKNWLADTGSVTRLAAGLVVGLPVDSRDEGYHDVERRLNGWVHLDPARSYDFAYQVNFPEPSKVIDHRLNRLFKWSVARQERIRSSIVLGTADLPATHNMASERIEYSVRHELDVNTHPVAGMSFDSQLLGSLFEEIYSVLTSALSEGLPPYAVAK